jgi:hypothetical protein
MPRPHTPTSALSIGLQGSDLASKNYLALEVPHGAFTTGGSADPVIVLNEADNVLWEEC